MATDARFSPDGTQAPSPPPAFPDPLAGLVTGVSSGSGIRDYTPDDFVEVEIAEPVEPDPEVVRGMVDAALSQEQDASTGPLRAVPRPAAAQRAPAAQPPLGMLAQQQSGTSVQTTRMRQALRTRQGRAQTERASSGDPVMRKPSSGSAGVALAIILLVVFGILIIQLISSLFSSVSGIFN
ncbi:hypothetical protein SAMN05216266_104298 [Amycolatopsis marina]|uniref:Uncharacterized protein n=1 Tax=Amycolatopsis marina TaxID=490629 RepID=A0A1I0Y7G5_9PSEU|nr:hypothetical protein [Amycolatopsis marina]SFB09345.1 hypothetical protein SAMN05216266_104298 [Amycolatopsis marina]